MVVHNLSFFGQNNLECNSNHCTIIITALRSLLVMVKDLVVIWGGRSCKGLSIKYKPWDYKSHGEHVLIVKEK